MINELGNLGVNCLSKTKFQILSNLFCYVWRSLFTRRDLKNLRREISEDCVKDAVFFHDGGEERLSGGSRDTQGQLRISYKAMVTQIQVQVTDEAKQCSTDEHADLPYDQQHAPIRLRTG